MGDALCDAGNLIMCYDIPSSDPDDPSSSSSGMVGISGLDLSDLRIPPKESLVSSYLRLLSSTPCPPLFVPSSPLVTWVVSYYAAFLFFKNAVISHGVKARLRQGTASAEGRGAGDVAGLAPIAVQIGMELLEDNKDKLKGGGRAKL